MVAFFHLYKYVRVDKYLNFCKLSLASDLIRSLETLSLKSIGQNGQTSVKDIKGQDCAPILSRAQVPSKYIKDKIKDKS